MTYQSHAHSLGQEDLPIGLAQAKHENAKDDEEVTNDEHRTKPSKVKEWPRKNTNKNQQPGLDGTYP